MAIGIAIVALMLAPAAAPQASKTVEATGEAAIYSGDVPAAKEKAREAALREAVNQAFGAKVTSVSESQDFTLVRDLVLTETAGYVSGYEALSEKVDEEAGVVTSRYRVTVSQGAIDRDAAAVAMLLQLKQQKRLYIQVSDLGDAGSSGGKAVYLRHGAFDNALRERLAADGFTVLDPNLVDGALAEKGAFETLESQEQAVALGDALNADLVIYGQARAQGEVSEVYGAKSFTSVVSVTLKAASPSSGEIIAGVQETFSQSNPASPAQAQALAMKVAAERSGETLRKKIYEAWRRQLGANQSVTFKVSGIDSELFAALTDALSTQVRSVKDVSHKSMRKGQAIYQLEVTGTSSQLASELSGRVVRGMKLKLVTIEPSLLEAELTK